MPFWKGMTTQSSQSPCRHLCIISAALLKAVSTACSGIAILLPCFCGAPPSICVPLTHSSPNTHSLTLSGYSHPSARSEQCVHDWGVTEALCPHTGYDAHGCDFHPTSQSPESTFWDVLWKLITGFLLENCQASWAQSISRQCPWRFQFFKSWKIYISPALVIYLPIMSLRS